MKKQKKKSLLADSVEDEEVRVVDTDCITVKDEHQFETNDNANENSKFVSTCKITQNVFDDTVDCNNDNNNHT